MKNVHCKFAEEAALVDSCYFMPQLDFSFQKNYSFVNMFQNKIFYLTFTSDENNKFRLTIGKLFEKETMWVNNDYNPLSDPGDSLLWRVNINETIVNNITFKNKVSWYFLETSIYLQTILDSQAFDTIANLTKCGIMANT